MKKISIVVFICLFIGSNLNSSCSCLPAASGLNNKYKLIEVIEPEGTINYSDSLFYLEFVRSEGGKDILFEDERVIAEKELVSADIPCGRESNNTFKYFYADGRVRRYHIPEPNQLEASEYLLEGEADTVLYRYEAVF